MAEAVHIAGWARTPLAPPMGQLARLGVPELGAAAVRAACEAAGVDPSGPQALLLGCQLTAGLGPNPATAVARAAELGPNTACRTIVSGRASGLQAVIQGFFEAGVYGTLVAAAVDSVSRSPMLVPKGRAGSRLGGSPIWDPAQHDAAIEAPGEPDEAFASASVERARKHAQSAWIATVEIPDRKKGPQPIDSDTIPEGGRGATAPLADGAAAVVLRGGEGTGPRVVAGVPNASDGGGPAEVAAGLLEMTGWSGADLVVLEVPEDVAGVAAATAVAGGAVAERVNPYGGSIGRGTPPSVGGVIGVVHACAALAAAGHGRALVVAGSGPNDAAGLAIEL